MIFSKKNQTPQRNSNVSKTLKKTNKSSFKTP